MRKHIALALALVMLLSLIPMTAFARTDNSVDYVPTVADDAVFTLNGTQTGTVRAPKLIIEDDAAGSTAYDIRQGDTFRLNLTNAEWIFDTDDGYDSILSYNGNLGDIAVTITKRTDTSITVRIDQDGSPGGEDQIIIPMLAEMDGEGEARVTIDPMNSRVSGGTYTFAIGQGGETTAFVDKVEDIARGRRQEAGSIIIDEVTAGALSGTGHGFRLRLPADFEWETDTVVRWEGFETVSPTTGDRIEYKIEGDGRDLSVRNLTIVAGDSRGSFIIEPSINVTRDARFGDVNVNLTGYGDVSNASGLKVAVYGDFGATFTVEEDGTKEFLTGRLLDNNDEEYEIEFTLEETVENSFIVGRDIDFIFPDWVWVLDVSVDDDAVLDSVNLKDKGDNTFSYSVGKDEEELTFTVKFTVDGNAPIGASGNITIEIDGAGISSMEEIIGVAKKPVTMEVKEQKNELTIGTMKQEVPDVIIKEVEAGALIEGEMLHLHIRENYGGSIRFDGFDVEVIEGDIELKDDDTNDGGRRMEVKIDRESTVASTIRFYNIRMDVDRSAPMGAYQLDVRGPAVVENTVGGYTDSSRTSRANYDLVDDIEEALKEADFSSRVARIDYVTVGTPINLQEPAVKGDVVFTVGQTTYTVGGETMTMDVAPFVKDGRLMVPVAHVSRALGIPRSAVVWDGDARTVTIYADKVMQMSIGSSTLLVNGIGSDMGAAAEIVGGRTFVPISRFARALGVDYEWDAAAQTVKFLNI